MLTRQWGTHFLIPPMLRLLSSKAKGRKHKKHQVDFFDHASVIELNSD